MCWWLAALTSAALAAFAIPSFLAALHLVPAQAVMARLQAADGRSATATASDAAIILSATRASLAARPRGDALLLEATAHSIAAAGLSDATARRARQERAFAALQALVDRTPSRADAWMRLSELYATFGEPGATVDALHRSLVLGPYDFPLIGPRLRLGAWLGARLGAVLGGGDASPHGSPRSNAKLDRDWADVSRRLAGEAQFAVRYHRQHLARYCIEHGLVPYVEEALKDQPQDLRWFRRALRSARAVP